MLRYQVLTSLANWLTEILLAIPPKLRPTMLELIVGCIAARAGHVTDAMLAIKPGKTWTTYYKAIESGVFSWTSMAKRWTKLICHVLMPEEIILALDDSVNFRCSAKAPAAAIHHDHAKRTNRSSYVLGQLFVCMAMICTYKKRTGAFPLIMALNPLTGNRSKINLAKMLIKIMRKWIGCSVPVRVVMDAWYMKGPVVFEVLKQGYHAIGQVRRDTVLNLVPEPLKKKPVGRPRKYGPRLTFQVIKDLFPQQEKKIKAYGKEKLFQYYSLTAMVRFLKGRQCRVVWTRFQRSGGQWTKWHLLISTDISLTGFQVIERYAKRWWIESCFHELKYLVGIKDAWQQSKRGLARWLCVLNIVYGLPKLLGILFGPKIADQLLYIPWRKNQPMTAGWAANALSRIFRGSRARGFWDRKHQKCCFPSEVLGTEYDKTG